MIFALVDDEDANRAAGIRWAAVETKRIDAKGATHSTLAVVHETWRGGRRKLWLARLVAGAEDGQKVEHLNGNALDCRRENLSVRWGRRA